ncbi:MAG: pirin family protein, partial [Pseudomonadota bacterium]
MSWNPILDPSVPIGDQVDLIETQIVPRARDIGNFEVRRALPAPQRQMVGPFIFFDQMGPAELLQGQGLDVRPHPHIGLATVTYLFDGAMHHRDSLGTDAWIEPGAVNWMVAGNGITHSERVDGERKDRGMNLSGIQTWVALPDHEEERDAAFHHSPKGDLPLIEAEGKQVRLILGTAYGEKAPVPVYSDMFYGDALLEAGAKLPLP